MDANPVLATFTRGNWVENRHRGAFCIADAGGTVIASAGDIEREIFPRSAIKALQALPIFETGADRRFAMDDEALALVCASHYGEPEHVRVAAAMLERAGLTADDLECGAHPPTSPAARKALRAAGEAPSALHNNCSGKHAGMLSVAKALGIDTKGYVTRGHEVQRRVRAAVEAVLETQMTEHKCGTDGCSIPTWAAPLKSFARGFARMATGEGLPEGMAAASRRLFDAATAHPFLIAGTDAFDTEAMAAFKGRLMIKIGAEGVFCGALRDKGLGFALKCDDGNPKVATAMIAGLLAAVAEPDAEAAAVLAKFSRQVSTNWRGIEVGALEAADGVRVGL
ncbi:asparaginase [Pelagibacterium xiamenense]|uniref:asparaginase n=1 Tax=Pelagibacterium xiamenense TaxID=2901140 RepID=UPI001E3D1FD5|nr:asparaginase [Pelagibacterium xiamenense]MCD7059411.1 asparaginase [Pelagibacterium xiamenense]